MYDKKAYQIFAGLENLLLKGRIDQEIFNIIWGEISFHLQIGNIKNPYNILDLKKFEFNVIDLCKYMNPGLNDNILRTEHYRETIRSVNPYIPSEIEKTLVNEIKSQMDQILTAEIVCKDLIYDISNCKDRSKLELLTK